ncbi:MAG: hypothetical protein WCY26_05925 [Thiohalobacteraceae bacterium]|nr:hypothetical protein [Gammaproteobacteria bacterium]
MDQRTPARKAPTPDSFDSRPAQVERWIAALPLANLGESGRRLYHTLIETNQTELPAEQRLAMLERLRAPLQTVADAMKAHFVGQPLPLTDKRRQIAELAQALAQQLALGYRIVVEDSAKGRGRFGNRRTRAVAIHRALNDLGTVLLRAYQTYAPYPTGVWSDIHALYQAAEADGIDATAIQDPEQPAVENTIEACYKRILLLALACPYRLRPGEVEQIHAWLADWCRHATLERLAEPRNPTGRFVVDFQSDVPPIYLVLHAAEYRDETCRILNATRLAEVVRDHLGSLRRDGQTGQRVNEQVLRRLMLAWGVLPKRRFSRRQRHSTAVVALGLSTAHYFIGGEAAFAGDAANPGLFDNLARFDAKEPAAVRRTTRDVWELGGARPLHDTHTRAAATQYIDFQSTTAPTGVSTKTPGAPDYRTHDWKMVNVSAGGYRLLWDSTAGSQARVGELLGLRESTDLDSFHLGLGVVRWMKVAAEGLELGVEMLAPGAVAVGAKKRGAGEYTRCLLLPAIEALDQPATLLTAALPYRVGDHLLVNSHGKELRVELTKLVENTGIFAQFQFHPLHHGAGTDAGTRDDFEALWELL